MDLEALRKAALQTKKRKRTLALAQQQPSADDDREEGEIDDTSPPPPPPASVQAPVPPRQEYAAPTAPTGARAPLPFPPVAPLVPPPSSTPQALHAIKEESKAIIAELLTYGVPPDYLLSIGVSRDILEISFHELNLSLSLPPLPSPSPSPHAPSAPPLPSTTTSSTAPPPPPNPDLTTLEARHRAALLARKAALVQQRNEQRALSLESELESLFAASPSSSTPVPSAAAAANGAEGEEGEGEGAEPAGRSRKRAKLLPSTSTSATDVHALRESIVEHTEKVVPIPEGGPFTASTSTLSGGNSVSHASSRPLLPASSTLSASRRPTAIDLEESAEPTRRISDQALTRGPAYLSRVAAGGMSLVIELSDSEEEGDGEGEDEEGKGQGGGDVPMANGTAPAEEEARRKREEELLEKDRELQRLKERIAALERKKKEGSVGKKSGRRSVEPEEKRKEKGKEEREKGGEDEEMGEAETEKEEDEMERREEEMDSKAESIPPVEDEAPPPTTTTEVIPSSFVTRNPAVQPVFRPYQSSLSRFPLIRQTPSLSLAPSTLSSTSSSSLSTNPPPAPPPVEAEKGTAALSTWAALRHGVSTSKRLCKAEASGGVCRDGGCKWVHFRGFGVSEEELAEYEALRSGAAPPPSARATSSDSEQDKPAANGDES